MAGTTHAPGQGPKPVTGIEAGDEVYVNHPERGPLAVRVLAQGRDGLTGTCERGERHRITWDRYLGHRRRMLHQWNVVDQGADGAVLDDGKGRRRFLAGELPPAGAPAGAEPEPQRPGDPLLGGLGRLKKAETPMFPDHARVLLLKAGTPLANRPGLALRPVTDRAGHRTQRWTRTTQDQPQGRRGAGDGGQGASRAGEANPGMPPLRHGDTAQFRHGDVGGEGKIIASGQDGVTLQDGEGNEHQVRHENLVKPGQPAAAGGGEGAGEHAGPPPLFSEQEVARLAPIASQPTADQEELYRKSGEALAQLQDWLDKGHGVCSQLGYQTMQKGMEDVDWSKPGGMLFIAPLKGEKRAAEKVEQDYGGDWSKLRDAVRCSIAVDTPEQLRATVDTLKKHGLDLAMRPKDRFHKPLPCGYRDLLLNVKMPNGIIGEVQVHLKGMLAAKKEGHKYYEIERSLIGKGTDKLTAEDQATIKDAHARMQAIYNEAWKSAAGSGSAGKGDMNKALGAEWEYLDHEGAQFRRRAGNASWAVDDVLHGREWKPYQGDRLHVGTFGDIIDDPLGGGDAGRMGKSMMLFLKATIPAGAAADLFPASVQVKGHTREGRYVAPFTSTRRKRPAPVPIDHAEARRIASAVFAHNRKRHASASYAAMIGRWQFDTRRKLSDANEGLILWHMKELVASAAVRPPAAKPRRDAAPEPEPEHLAKMRAALARIEGGRHKTAGDERIEGLYRRRLGADPAKWKPGRGVSYQVNSGRGMQTNRGFRIVEVDPANLMALVRSVADTGLTTTGGNHDRIEDDWRYLGELKRDKKYDA